MFKNNINLEQSNEIRTITRKFINRKYKISAAIKLI